MQNRFRVVILGLAVGLLMMFSAKAYADDYDALRNQVADVYVHVYLVKAKLDFLTQPVDYPHASGYYDDLEDHYEQEQIMSDFIDKGLE